MSDPRNWRGIISYCLLYGLGYILFQVGYMFMSYIGIEHNVDSKLQRLPVILLYMTLPSYMVYILIKQLMNQYISLGRDIGICLFCYSYWIVVSLALSQQGTYAPMFLVITILIVFLNIMIHRWMGRILGSRYV